jgi:hypothetical protein
MTPPSASARRAQARAFVRAVVTPTVAAAFNNYPELEIHEVLRLCEPALVEALVTELEFANANGRPAA